MGLYVHEKFGRVPTTPLRDPWWRTITHWQMRESEREPFYDDIAHVIRNTKKSVRRGIRTRDGKAFGHIITLYTTTAHRIRIL